MAVAVESMDAGLDLDRTRERLTAYLISGGWVGPQELPTELPADASSKARDENLWLRAREAALPHMLLHGEPARMRVDNGEWQDVHRCSIWPCRGAGAAFALEELCKFWEMRDALMLAEYCSKLTAQLDAVNAALFAGVAERAERLLTAGSAPGWLSSEPMQNGLQLCIRAGADFERVHRLLRVMSSALPDAPTTRRPKQSVEGFGRPVQALRKAIWQHLHFGGVPFPEIARLAPEVEQTASDPSLRAASDRIRKAVAGDDVRGVRPWDPMNDAGARQG
jgi:hypothetical protein